MIHTLIIHFNSDHWHQVVIEPWKTYKKNLSVKSKLIFGLDCHWHIWILSNDENIYELCNLGLILGVNQKILALRELLVSIYFFICIKQGILMSYISKFSVIQLLLTPWTTSVSLSLTSLFILLSFANGTLLSVLFWHLHCSCLAWCCETLRRGGIVGNLASWEALERKSEDLNHPLLLFISGYVVEASLTSCIWRSIHLTLDWTLWIWVKTNHLLLFIRLFFSDIC